MKNGPYILVKAPLHYPGKRYRGKYLYEHHLVWWQHTGQVVPEGYVVHHKDEDRHNNRFENLELKVMKAHSREHGFERGRPPTELLCAGCGKNFLYSTRNYLFKKKRGQQTFSCSRSCGAKKKTHSPEA